ncbi:hypothetical protein AB4089_17090 [Arthrobacter sp. 2MCAF15]|uniref:hypothetical protein n=1 Tax=Arthrobacter sp. 2MCAF15 TaxID=3232984 RepID=UPI003F8EB09C
MRAAIDGTEAVKGRDTDSPSKVPLEAAVAEYINWCNYRRLYWNSDIPRPWKPK